MVFGSTAWTLGIWRFGMAACHCILAGFYAETARAGDIRLHMGVHMGLFASMHHQDHPLIDELSLDVT